MKLNHVPLQLISSFVLTLQGYLAAHSFKQVHSILTCTLIHTKKYFFFFLYFIFFTFNTFRDPFNTGLKPAFYFQNSRPFRGLKPIRFLFQATGLEPVPFSQKSMPLQGLEHLTLVLFLPCCYGSTSSRIKSIRTQGLDHSIGRRRNHYDGLSSGDLFSRAVHKLSSPWSAPRDADLFYSNFD